jgi:hypothetical protein
MTDTVTPKGTTEQPNTTPADANVKAPAHTGDRELSDADLDRVAGGSAPEPTPAVRPQVRSLLVRSQ